MIGVVSQFFQFPAASLVALVRGGRGRAASQGPVSFGPQKGSSLSNLYLAALPRLFYGKKLIAVASLIGGRS